ncbi:MAG TPA: GNAT family protein [Fimbriimonadaceae bacterium]|nr:GNAT family protein [Fimbriimonadaceae bacterium]
MLRGEKVNLRTVRSRDLETYLELSSEIGTRGEYYPLQLPTETSLRARFEKDGFWGEDTGLLLIVDRQSDRILGMIVYFKPVHYYDGFEIGYILFNPTDRGKGYMTEALRLFCRYLFDLKPIHRLQVQVQRENAGSRKVAEKCGFQFEGTSRSAFVSHGQPVDIDVFSLLRGELR